MAVMINQMVQLNKIGEALGKIEGVTAMTDVTGFGLLGHLIEMAGLVRPDRWLDDSWSGPGKCIAWPRVAHPAGAGYARPAFGVNRFRVQT